MLSTSSWSSKSSQRFLRIDAIHHNMAHFISESTVHKYQYSIEHFPETSSLMTSGSGTNYDFSICSICSHSSLSLWELQTSFPDVGGHLHHGRIKLHLMTVLSFNHMEMKVTTSISSSTWDI